MNCPKCGTAVNAGSKFCGSCDFDLSSINQSTTMEPSASINNQEQTEQLEQLEQQEQPVMFQNNVEQSQNSVMNQNVSMEQPNNNTAQMSNPMMNQTTSMEINNNQIVNNQSMNNNLNQQPENKKGNSKSLIIVGIVGVLLLIIAIVGAVFLMPSSEEKKEKEVINEMFDPDSLIKVKKDDKYGFIDTSGKFVLDAVYETATDFYGDYAIVRAQVEENGIQTSTYQIIDKKGNVKKQGAFQAEYLEETQMWVIDNELYNSSLKRISKENVKVESSSYGYFVWVNSVDNTGGIMNSEGKITYTYQFQNSEDYINIDPSRTDESLTERYCRINVDNDKYAIVNCDTGVVVYDFTAGYISTDSDNIFNIYVENTWDKAAVVYIQGDKIVYKADGENADKISITHYPGYLSIRDGSKSYSEGRYSYFHLDTLEIKSERPATTTTEDEEEVVNEWEKYTGNTVMYQNSKYGLSNGETITLPAEWDSLEYIEINLYKYLEDNKKEYIYGKKDDKWYLIDLTTKSAIVEFNTTYIRPDDETTFMHYTDKDTSNQKVYNLLTGAQLNVPSGTDLTVYSNYITVKDNTNKTLKYYNTKLELIYTESL